MAKWLDGLGAGCKYIAASISYPNPQFIDHSGIQRLFYERLMPACMNPVVHNFLANDKLSDTNGTASITIIAG